MKALLTTCRILAIFAEKNFFPTLLKFNFSFFFVRLTAIFLFLALLFPAFLLKGAENASAKNRTNNLPLADTSAVRSALPEPFVLSYPDALKSASSASFLSSVKTTVAKSFNSILAFALLSRTNTAAAEPEAAAAAVLHAQGSVKFDFDGDGKADPARWRSAGAEWKVKNSSTGAATSATVGASGQTIAPADYDGDGKTDFATFAATTGTWTIRKSSDLTMQTITNFGQAGDKPVSGDYDGDGVADLAVWRSSNGTWYIKQSSTSTVISAQYGLSTDVPVPGNYDGDSKMDYAVFRPSNNWWYVYRSSTGTESVMQWGLPGDVHVPADYDGDGITDYAVYRPNTGTWYALKSSSGNTAGLEETWGNYGDQPVPADYDGDGEADFAVWRPSTGVWHIKKSSDNTYSYQSFGIAGDVTAESAYLKQVGSQVYGYDLAKTRLSPKNATGGTDLYSRNFSWGTSLAGLPGRAGLDAGFGIGYNSLVWTKHNETMIFDVDMSSVTPGFRFGYPTIEPSYFDSQTGKYAFLMVTPSGARVEFKQTAASSVYETADSSYSQLSVRVGRRGAEVEDTVLTVKTADGTSMTYAWRGGAYRCSQIKDRNGNFITINHDENGLLRTVTDTLGRVLTVGYDNQLYPTSVTQTWKDNNGQGSNTTHTYATFSYADMTVNTNFGSLGVSGPANGTVLKVLNKITRADGSYTTFDYNSYAQVKQINNYAADNHKLNHTAVNLPADASTPQADCPRFSETRSWIENFNNNQETVVTNSIQENQTYSTPAGAGTATLIEVALQNDPTGHVSKTFVGSSGWTEGLPIVTEDWANENNQGLERKRWTLTSWTQDDTTKTYITNPRVVESKVGDATNIKRTTVEYYTQTGLPATALYGLVKEVKVFDADQTTVLKRAYSEYNLDSIYTSKRILGLPSKSELYDQTGALMSKVTYAYDEGDFSGAGQTVAPVQQDNLNYGASFIIGRGNLTSTTRHDVTGQTAAVTSQIKYNTAGAAVSQITPGSAAGTTREVKISYQDSFNDGLNTRNTFAYPTKIYDPAGNFSEVKYRFDTGANVWAKSPAPANNTTGKETVREFDSVGRLLKETLVNTGAYTRYEYPTNAVQSKVYSTIVDVNNNGADATDEVFAESWTDGAGRVRQSRTELPNSAGGYSGSLIEYDILGRAKRQTVPTEINSAWQPAGDDASRGWLWTQQEYDWKGRAVRTFNTDGTDTLTSYEGCGCAGGEIVTVESEQLTEGRRKQKSYSDLLGRNYKNEILDWQGNVYKTIVNSYNGRDQVTLSRVYAGTETSNEFQETIYNYDGHGRLQAKHNPEQDANKFTTYTYFADDKPQTITDARGAAKQYQYNSLGLIQQISYQSPSQVPIVYTEPIITQAIGNIDGSIYKLQFNGLNLDTNAELSVDIIVNNGTSWQNLRYNNLERSTENGEQVLKFDITSDSYLYNYVNTNSYVMKFSVVNPNTNKKTQDAFIDYLNGSGGRYVRVNFSPPPSHYPVSETPTVSFSYDNLGNRISMNDAFGNVAYEYNELSQLTSETRQFNETIPTSPLSDNRFKIQYTYGLSGQLKSLTEPYGEIISYGHDKIGRLKNVSGNRVSENIQLNYVTDAKYRAWGAVKKLDYGNNKYVEMNYNNRLQAQDFTLANTGSSVINYQSYEYYSDGRLKFSSPAINSMFDRLYEYDFLGRLATAKTGAEARGQTETNPNNRPYRMTLEYNQFGDIINQQRLHWSASFGSTFQYQNQRMMSETGIDNIPGWLAQTTALNYTHDADGRRIDDMQYNADGKISRVTKAEQEAASGHDGEYYEWSGSSIKYDGDGNIIKIIKDGMLNFGSGGAVERRTFRINSSVVGDVITKLELDWTPNSGYDSGLSKKEHRYVYANGKEVAERRIYVRPLALLLEDSTVLKTSDASGVDKLEMNLLGDGYSTLSLSLDPFGANVGDPYPLPPPSGYPDPNDPNCTWNDYDDFDCDFPDEYEDGENEDQQAGSVAENTCYENDREKDCQVALRDVDEDTPVTKEDEFPDDAPSDEGPEGIHQNDDTSDDDTSRDAGEKDFDAHYSGMDVWFDENAGVAVEITGSSVIGTVSNWDLRRETSLERQKQDAPFNIPKIKAGVEEVLKTKGCENLIQGLLNDVSSKKNPLVEGGNINKLLGLLLEQNQFTRKAPKGSAGFGSPIGSFKEKSASVFIATLNVNGTPALQLQYDIKSAIDELMHLAGKNRNYTDRDFAEVVHADSELAKSNYLTNLPPYTPQTYPLDRTDLTKKQKNELKNNTGDALWSRYWHTVVENSCYSNVDWNKITK